MSGVRVRTEELAKLGVTLPGFVNRGKVIASLPSLGLLVVAALTPEEHEVRYLEVADIRDVTELPEFDLVGISSFTAQIDEAYELAGRYRARGTPVVIGGTHTTLRPDEAETHADAIVCGGAEEAWPELLRDFEQGAMKRRYRGTNRGFYTRTEPVMPRFELLRGRPYNRITLQTRAAARSTATSAPPPRSSRPSTSRNRWRHSRRSWLASPSCSTGPSSSSPTTTPS